MQHPAFVSYNGTTATVVADCDGVQVAFSLRCYSDGTVAELTDGGVGYPYSCMVEFLFSRDLEQVEPRRAVTNYFGTLGSRLVYWLSDPAGHVLGWFVCDRDTEALPESAFLSLDQVNWLAPEGYTFYKTYEEVVADLPDVFVLDLQEGALVFSDKWLEQHGACREDLFRPLDLSYFESF